MKHSFLTRTQKGFTLIELMIVVGLIGSLAAVAIPAYTDYMKRGKVSEAVQLLGALKAPTEEYLANKGFCPPDLSVLTDKTSGKYTTGLKISSDCVYEIGFKSDDSVLLQYKLGCAYCNDDKQWYWDSTNAGTTVPDKYLPAIYKVVMGVCISKGPSNPSNSGS